MAGNRKIKQPEVEVKQFDVGEIELGIRKLNRRIEQVKLLNDESVRVDDQRVDNAEADISNTILEIFGPNSLEYRNNQYYQIWNGPHIIKDSESSRQIKFEQGIPQAIIFLEGLIRRLEEKRDDISAQEIGTNTSKLTHISKIPVFYDLLPSSVGGQHGGQHEVTFNSSIYTDVPNEIQESMAYFKKDYPNSSKVAFIIMQFGKTKDHTMILNTIKDNLKLHEIIGVRADDKEYHDDLFLNIKTYMHGCGLGIAVFERIQDDDFNPNVSLEVGYMMALNKPICLLKDSTLRSLHTDLAGKLYRSFDRDDINTSINEQLTRWLKDKGLI